MARAVSSPRFLVDECTPESLPGAIRQRDPNIDVLCVGEPGAPAKGTKDRNLLLAAEALGRLLLTRDKRTMPRHIAAHVAAGHHTWGVFLLRGGFPVPRYVDEIHLVWGASEADEWIDLMRYLP
jgi:hypothetical protein